MELNTKHTHKIILNNNHWHYSSLKETIRILETTLKKYNKGKKTERLRKILKNRFYLVESIFYYARYISFS
ncbi:hypothetical protein KO317_03035 [Candidatus Micrarchaeota archaeon]|jgi:hypothetical protein|nr:hypothetical protein [Candidatus Micrarchaeota archaeon]